MGEYDKGINPHVTFEEAAQQILFPGMSRICPG
jgi:hypothetical protein